MSEPTVIIPARGGSQRIPGKNTRLLAGIPTLERTIRIAQASGVSAHIYVSTDSPEIATLARSLEATVIDRPAELADNHTALLPVLNHALGHLGDLGLVQDLTPVACLYATAVTLAPTDFHRGFAQLMSEPDKRRMVIGVVEYPHPIERALLLDSASHLVPVSPEFATTRTQDLPTHYFDAGSFIWGFARDWYLPAPILTRADGCVLPPWRSVDLDSEDDWARAELIISELERGRR